MKTLETILFLAFFVLMHTGAFGQSKLAKKSERNASVNNYPPIAIKVYTCPNGTQSLMVYNPDHPDFYFYGNAPFTLRWYCDGEYVGYKPFLGNVCGREFTVEVYNHEEGWDNSKQYYMGCRETSVD